MIEDNPKAGRILYYYLKENLKGQGGIYAQFKKESNYFEEINPLLMIWRTDTANSNQISRYPGQAQEATIIGNGASYWHCFRFVMSR